jgi:hypothetical protein
MPNEVAKMTQKPDPQKRVKEVVRQLVGQTSSTHNMLADIVLELMERVEKLEKESRQKIAA